jgi:tetratricopeptide (TPR) repeat protein
MGFRRRILICLGLAISAGPCGTAAPGPDAVGIDCHIEPGSVTPELWRAQFDRANQLRMRAVYREAEQCYEAALDMAQALPSPDASLRQVRLQQSVLYTEQAKYGKSEELLLSICGQPGNGGPRYSEEGRCLQHLGELYYLTHRYGDAAEVYRRALSIFKQAADKDDVGIAESLRGLGDVCTAEGRLPEARAFYDEALRSYGKVGNPAVERVAFVWNSLGVVAHDAGQYGEAEQLFRQALDVREKILGPKHPLIAQSLINLGVLLSRHDRLEEAELLYRRAASIYYAVLGAWHPATATLLMHLGTCITGGTSISRPNRTTSGR